jgi:4'-phosphopantetheinyl transferase
LFSLAKKKQLDYFFDLWTLKESYLKAIGTGLTKSLRSFTIQKNSDGICLLEDEVKNDALLEQVQFDRGYKLSVCTWDESINDNISVLFINDLLEMLHV